VQLVAGQAGGSFRRAGRGMVLDMGEDGLRIADIREGGSPGPVGPPGSDHPFTGLRPARR